MSNKRWDSKDKIELMKLYSQGKSYEEIGKSLDRSPNAVKLRLESIVYDNLVKGKPITLLTRMLNTNNDTIKQLYYSHKSFKEGRGEKVQHVEFPHDGPIPIPINPIGLPMNQSINGGGGGSSSGSKINSIMRTTNNDQKHRIMNADKNTNKPSMIGENNIEQIEQENHILEGIINNYRMRRQVRKLYIEGKLDERGIAMYEKLIKNTKDV